MEGLPNTRENSTVTPLSIISQYKPAYVITLFSDHMTDMSLATHVNINGKAVVCLRKDYIIIMCETVNSINANLFYL